jgi:hypothetical protein
MNGATLFVLSRRTSAETNVKQPFDYTSLFFAIIVHGSLRFVASHTAICPDSAVMVMAGKGPPPRSTGATDVKKGQHLTGGGLRLH